MFVRKTTEKDIPRILKIEQEAISPPWTQDALLSEIYKDDSFFVVAVDGVSDAGIAVSGVSDVSDAEVGDSHILGFAILRQVGDDGELLQIAVDISARHKGVGDLLIKAVLEHAKENGFNSVFLEVRKSNEAAVQLYEKRGFKSIRIRRDYYINPVEDALVMVR